MDVVLIFAVAKAANYVDARDNGINELVCVRHHWIGDVLMLELDSVAHLFAPGCLDMAIVSAIVFRQSIQVPIGY